MKSVINMQTVIQHNGHNRGGQQTNKPGLPNEKWSYVNFSNSHSWICYEVSGEIQPSWALEGRSTRADATARHNGPTRRLQKHTGPSARQPVTCQLTDGTDRELYVFWLCLQANLPGVLAFYAPRPARAWLRIRLSDAFSHMRSVKIKGKVNVDLYSASSWIHI